MLNRRIKELVAEITRRPELMLNQWHIPTDQQKQSMMRVLLKFPKKFANLLSAVYRADPRCESEITRAIYHAFFNALIQSKTASQIQFLNNIHSEGIFQILVIHMWEHMTPTSQSNLLSFLMKHSNYTINILMELCDSDCLQIKSLYRLALDIPNEFLFTLISNHGVDQDFISDFVQSTAVQQFISGSWSSLGELTRIKIINFLSTDVRLVDMFLIPLCVKYKSALHNFIAKILDVYDEQNISLMAKMLPFLGSKERSEIFKVLTLCREDGLPYVKQLAYLDGCLRGHAAYDTFVTEFLCECVLSLNLYIFHTFPNYAINLSELAKKDLISLEEFNLFCSAIEGDYSDKDRRLISSFIPQLRFGVDLDYCVSVGNIGVVNEDGMLLTLAQTKARKGLKNPNAQLNCTLLSVNEKMTAAYQINAFFNIIKNAGKPLSERFIMRSEGHWMSGVVWVDNEGFAHLFLMDSLRLENVDYYPAGFFKAYYDAFPEGLIYAANFYRQNSSRGCAVFAYEDCMKSQSMYDHYFGGDEGLLAYLLENIVEEIPACDSKIDTDYSLEINLVSLPARFLRLMQSSKVYDLIKVENQKNPDFRINKKNETAEEAVSRHFIDDGGRAVNARINYKMNKMASLNRSFLFSHSNLKDILSRRLQEEFTLSGLRERYNDFTDYGLLSLPDEFYLDNLMFLAQAGVEEFQRELNDMSSYAEGRRLIDVYDDEISVSRPSSPTRMLDLSVTSCE